MAARDAQHSSDGAPADSFDAWWERLSGEDRYLIMDNVRLEESVGLAEIEGRHPAPAALVKGKGPSAALSDFVRRHVDYLQRFAIADNTARVDPTPDGPGEAPEVHERTAPIIEDDGPAPR